MHDAVCSRCGKATTISFLPDGVRPIFCKECLISVKDEKKREVEFRLQAKKQELSNIGVIANQPGGKKIIDQRQSPGTGSDATGREF